MNTYHPSSGIKNDIPVITKKSALPATLRLFIKKHIIVIPINVISGNKQKL
jgi:hypothetical protein